MKASGNVLSYPQLAQQKWLRHGFGTRKANPDLKLPLVRAKQIHSDVIHIVTGDAKLRGDALITATPGIAIGVVSADCVPVLLADPVNRVVAAIHAGWRGTLKRITQKTVGTMRAAFGTNPGKLIAAIGPSIQVCCYEVGLEVISEFQSQFAYADELFEHLDPENPAFVMLPRQNLLTKHALMRDLDPQPAFLNVEEANARQLLEAGVIAKNILRGAPCTSCRLDLLHSYRKEGKGCGQQMSAIGILN